MVMRTIDNIKNNNWAGIATDAAAIGASFIPGVGPVASAALSAGVQAGGTVAQGGGAGDAIKSGVFSLIGSGLGAVVSKLAKTETKTPTPDTTTGGAAPVPATNTNLSLSQKIDAKAPGPTKLNMPNQPTTGTPGTIPGNTIKYSAPAASGQTSSNITGRIGSTLKGAANTVKNRAGKIAGQGVIQGALSIASMVGAARQASAANKVSEQSLLFQKQTYNEQKAEVESNKAKLKSDALTDYQSASLFGESLYGSDSNSTLLTSYYTNGTGNAGNFSLIGSSINTSRQTDLT